MSLDKRCQVFVGSTFKDLKEAREGDTGRPLVVRNVGDRKPLREVAASGDLACGDWKDSGEADLREALTFEWPGQGSVLKGREPEIP